MVSHKFENGLYYRYQEDFMRFSGVRYALELQTLQTCTTVPNQTEEDDTNQSVSSIEDDFVTALEHLEEEDTGGKPFQKSSVLESQWTPFKPRGCVPSPLTHVSESEESECSSPSPIIFLDEVGYQKSLLAKLDIPQLPGEPREQVEDSDSERYSDFASSLSKEILESVCGYKSAVDISENKNLSCVCHKEFRNTSGYMMKLSEIQETVTVAKIQKKLPCLKDGIQRFATDLVQISLGSALRDLQKSVSCTSTLCHLAARLTSSVFQMAFHEIGMRYAYLLKERAISGLASLLVGEALSGALKEFLMIKNQIFHSTVKCFAANLAEELVFEGTMEVCQFSHPSTPITPSECFFGHKQSGNDEVVSSYASDLSESVIQEVFIELSQTYFAFPSEAAISVSLDNIYVSTEKTSTGTCSASDSQQSVSAKPAATEEADADGTCTKSKDLSKKTQTIPKLTKLSTKIPPATPPPIPSCHPRRGSGEPPVANRAELSYKLLRSVSDQINAKEDEDKRLEEEEVIGINCEEARSSREIEYPSEIVTNKFAGYLIKEIHSSDKHTRVLSEMSLHGQTAEQKAHHYCCSPEGPHCPEVKRHSHQPVLHKKKRMPECQARAESLCSLEVPKIHIDQYHKTAFAEEMVAIAMETAKHELSNTSLNVESGIGHDGTSYDNSLTAEITTSTLSKTCHDANISFSRREATEPSVSQQLSVGDDSLGSWSNLSFEDDSSSFLHLSDSTNGNSSSWSSLGLEGEAYEEHISFSPSDSDNTEDKESGVKEESSETLCVDRTCRTTLVIVNSDIRGNGCDPQHASVDPQLRSMLQWVAASLADIPHIQLTRDKDLKQLPAVVQRVREKKWKVGELLHAVLQYCDVLHSSHAREEDVQADRGLNHTPLFQWILDHV
ncbi:A-kinase anchor protein 11 [Takifugu flavidus]|uniref:A-kinase anchor protein 11 n=1 Tax=Takifugu flavidus TaxID=433684 RepID=A0A5C6PP27_9TELE|nr:A-kinase anchor protein 11 [Takifugu flavidus]